MPVYTIHSMVCVDKRNLSCSPISIFAHKPPSPIRLTDGNISVVKVITHLEEMPEFVLAFDLAVGPYQERIFINLYLRS